MSEAVAELVLLTCFAVIGIGTGLGYIAAVIYARRLRGRPPVIEDKGDR